MKKILIFLTIAIIIVAIVEMKYYSYRAEHRVIVEENSQYEAYIDKEIYGIDLATLMNKAVDKNTKNKVSKTEEGIFIPNETNSIEIEIYIRDNDTTYKMERFYNSGTEMFIQYYGHIRFILSKIQYHESTQRVKYLLFEQI